MKLTIIAAALTAAALPVLAQTGTAPVEPRQARVEVSDPANGTASATKKASKPARSAKTAKKSTRKKAAKKKPQSVG